MCIINDWLGLVNLRSHESINTVTLIQISREGRITSAYTPFPCYPRADQGDYSLKSFYCVYVFPQNWRTVAWRQRELMNTETGSRNRGKNGLFYLFCLKTCSGIKGLSGTSAPKLPCILLDAQIDLLRMEARRTSIILV